MLAGLVGPSGYSLWPVRASAALSPLSREIREEVEKKRQEKIPKRSKR